VNSSVYFQRSVGLKAWRTHVYSHLFRQHRPTVVAQ
jgi:hypothetical protein